MSFWCKLWDLEAMWTWNFRFQIQNVKCKFWVIFYIGITDHSSCPPFVADTRCEPHIVCTRMSDYAPEISDDVSELSDCASELSDDVSELSNCASELSDHALTNFKWMLNLFKGFLQFNSSRMMHLIFQLCIWKFRLHIWNFRSSIWTSGSAPEISDHESELHTMHLNFQAMHLKF